MGLFDALFPRSSAAPPERWPDIRFDNDLFVSVRSRGFFGRYRRSTNGSWAVCWSDWDAATQRGGARQAGQGTYLLCDVAQDKVVLAGKMQRPSNGHVADNGVFLLEDWLFGDALQGVVYVGDAIGRTLLQRRLAANIFNSGLSADGRWAVCQTCNNPDSDDGNRLSLFDLSDGKALFSIFPATRWADAYDLRPADQKCYVIINELGQFAYSDRGAFLDEAAYEVAQLEKGDYTTAILAAEALLKKRPDAEAAQRALAALQRALRNGAESRADWKAQALKVRGIALEVVGRLQEALESYDGALALNPKVGAKRRAAQLRKQLGAME